MIRTVDETGASFPNVLIIVRSLSDGAEQARYLSNFKGETPEIKIDDGLSQVIATCPYGTCKTVVREFLATTVPSVLVLPLSVRATDEIGELVGTKTATIVFRPANKGAISGGAGVFVRDADAVRQKWYKTDADGKVTIQTLGERTNILVLYANAIYRYVLANNCLPTSANGDVNCVVIQDSAITLDAYLK